MPTTGWQRLVQCLCSAFAQWSKSNTSLNVHEVVVRAHVFAAVRLHCFQFAVARVRFRSASSVSSTRKTTLLSIGYRAATDIVGFANLFATSNQHMRTCMHLIVLLKSSLPVPQTSLRSKLLQSTATPLRHVGR